MRTLPDTIYYLRQILMNLQDLTVKLKNTIGDIERIEKQIPPLEISNYKDSIKKKGA